MLKGVQGEGERVCNRIVSRRTGTDSDKYLSLQHPILLLLSWMRWGWNERYPLAKLSS